MNRRTMTIAFTLLLVAWGIVFVSNSLAVEEAPVVVVETPPLPTPDSLLVLVNEERTKNGVAPLVMDDRLNRSAQLKAEDMDDKGYFGHEAPDGKRGPSYVFDVAPGLCYRSSENLTDNIHVNDSYSAFMAWKKSQSHYEAMLDPRLTLTGFGIDGTKIVQHFCQVR